jgi:DNA-binding winged helix-turn-helix (wHTH) protein
VFTTSYPLRHRNFTPSRDGDHTVPLPVDDNSFRSYEGGAPPGRHATRGVPATERPAPVRGLSIVAQRAIVHGNLEIRLDEIQALVGGHRVGLTVREFQVLLVLAKREDRVVRRADIYREVWGEEMRRRDRSVDVFVRKVRNKLAQTAPGWTYIHTHFGVGYRFAAVPQSVDSPAEPLAASELAAPQPEPATA